jgi:hypothetical protein
MSGEKMSAEIIATTVTTTTEKTLQAATAAEVEAVMTDAQLRRELPRSTTELVGQTAGDVTQGLGRHPLMLGVVILNIIGIGCAVYFLSLLINGQQGHLKELLEIQTSHLKQVLDVHNREFDALMDMQAKSAAALAAMAASLTPPPTAPVSQQQPPAPTQPSRR